ncbi:hypothetical protein ACN47E_010167 [Coniothyrium glycines]
MAGTKQLSHDYDGSLIEQQAGIPQRARELEYDEAHDPQFVPLEHADTVVEETTTARLPLSRSTKGFCTKCQGIVGEFYNSWHKITGSYYTPALLGSYRSFLSPTGRQRAASQGTILEKCASSIKAACPQVTSHLASTPQLTRISTIQPVSCPSAGCTGSPIGFTVLQTPVSTNQFRSKDFFKLGRIELRCETTLGTIIVVGPQEEPAHETIFLENSLSPSEETEHLSEDSSPHAMDTNTYTMSTAGHRNEQTHVYAYSPSVTLQSEANVHASTSFGHPSGTPSTMTVQATTESMLPPSPAADLAEVQEHSAKGLVQNVKVLTSPEHVRERSKVHTTGQAPQENGHAYPKTPVDVRLDAIERLQTQISQNSGALAAHTRDIRRGEESFVQLEEVLRRDFQSQLNRQGNDLRRMDEAITTLHSDMQGIHQMLESITRELHCVRVDGGQPHTSSLARTQTSNIQDSALELMAQRIATTSQKTQEIETLKITVEILKNKIQRFEDTLPLSSSAQPGHQADRALYTETLQPSQSARSVSYNHAGPADLLHSGRQAQSHANSQKRSSYSTSTILATPNNSQRAEGESNRCSTWTTVNAGSKRLHLTDAERTPGSSMSAPASPKRRRLDSGELNTSHGEFQGHIPTQHVLDQPSNHEPPHPPYVPVLSSQHIVREASFEDQLPQAVYFHDSKQDCSTTDSVHPQAQRAVDYRPRVRGRGRGTASRVGKGRNSLPYQFHPPGTSEWEHEQWQDFDVSDSNARDRHSHATYSGRGIARRGSGGGSGRIGYTPNDRGTGLGLPARANDMSPGSPGDLYAHTKKTRTKPVRNADGVLIRKDGRPDMRSQSSAANLRKVHARKEGDASPSPTGFTPATSQYFVSPEASTTPGSTSFALEKNLASSVDMKHNAIMHKIFPSGTDASRRRHDYTHQVFEEEHEHRVQPYEPEHAPLSMKSQASTMERAAPNSTTSSRPGPNDEPAKILQPQACAHDVKPVAQLDGTISASTPSLQHSHSQTAL